MKARLSLVLAFAVVFALPAVVLATRGSAVDANGGGTPGTARNFELIGHAPLFNRGMNAALALYGRYVYVGNRTDGQPKHPHPGILIVDVKRPSSPRVVGEIGPPHAAQVGVTTRELRVWPEENLLVVMTFRCSATIHDCPPGDDAVFPFDLKFFDLTDPVNPRFISSYVPTSKAGRKTKPHEMFLWVDPKNDDRALLWLSTPTSSKDESRPNLMIVDISRVPDGGAVEPVAEGNWNHLFADVADPSNLALHSIGVNVSGTRTYFAHLEGETLVLDSSDVAEGKSNPELRLLTPPANRPRWTNPESHTAVKVFDRPLGLNTDEVYGKFTRADFGCPWGWLRLLDVKNEAQPTIVGEYKLPQNELSYCATVDPAEDSFTSYSSHNPTVLRKLALVTWHSGGLQAVDIARASRPSQGGWFSPRPLPTVATEDPALSLGRNRVVMWSYPIVKDGLIYVIDIRNGLYVLRYKGRHSGEVKRVDFLEGNSNLGDAERLAGRGD